MPYTVTITEKSGFLHAQVTGENNLQTVMDYTAEISLECRRRNCWKVLIEENLQGDPMPLVDIYHAASKGSERAKQPIVVAFVDTNPLHPFQNMQFAEKVAVNRGLNLRVFDSVQKAEAWIQQVSNPPSHP